VGASYGLAKTATLTVLPHQRRERAVVEAGREPHDHHLGVEPAVHAQPPRGRRPPERARRLDRRADRREWREVGRVEGGEAWMVKRSENGDLGGLWQEGHGLPEISEVLGLSSRVRRAAQSLQMQPDEPVVASYGPAKTPL